MKMIEGDPDFVGSQASDMLHTAETLAKAATKLDGLAHGSARSDAMDVLAVAVTELASVLASAHDRYQPAGQALVAYGPSLRNAMTLVSHALSASGQTDVGTAHHQADSARMHELLVEANPMSSQHDKDEASHAHQQAQIHLDHQRQALAAAQTHYDSAMADLHVAAQRARDQIDSGIKQSHLNDGFKDHCASILAHLDDVLAEVLKALHEILDAIGILLSAIGLAIALLGPEAWPFAAFFDFLGMVASGLDMSVQTIRFSRGDITFGEYMASMLLGLTGLLLGFVGGKATGKLIASKGGRKLAESVLDVTFTSVSGGTGDPLADWIDSLDGPPPHVPSYADIDVDQIAEQSGIDVPGRIRVAPVQPTPPLQVAPPAPTPVLQVAPPESYPVEITVYASPRS